MYQLNKFSGLFLIHKAQVMVADPQLTLQREKSDLLHCFNMWLIADPSESDKSDKWTHPNPLYDYDIMLLINSQYPALCRSVQFGVCY